MKKRLFDQRSDLDNFICLDNTKRAERIEFFFSHSFYSDKHRNTLFTCFEQVGSEKGRTG